jgi:hypothetical protein
LFGLFVILALLSIIGFIVSGTGWLIKKFTKQNVKKFKLICLSCIGVIVISFGGCAVTVQQELELPDQSSTAITPTPDPSEEPSSEVVAAVPTTSPATTDPIVKSSPKASAVAGNIAEIADVTLEFPSDRFPETAAHILSAISSGKSAVCTIDRNGAEDNRAESLKGIETKKGFDRDEWPMAMCAEGGKDADIAYVTPSDNRGAGSWVGNQLEDLKDGTKVLFVVGESDATVDAIVPTTDAALATVKPVATKKPTSTAKTAATKAPTAKPTEAPVVVEETVYYANCSAVRAAGADPIYEGDPGYSRKLDRDGDGVACE